MISKLYWHRSANFGDCLSPYLFEKITGRKPEYCEPSDPEPHLIMIGSLLEAAGPQSIIWGAGFCYQNADLPKPGRVVMTRGALSRQKYINAGIKVETEYHVDPAELLPNYYDRPQQSKYELGITPHVQDIKKALYDYANMPGIRVIDLSLPVEEVVDQMRLCKRIASSSLHGLVVAAAYDIPSYWLEFSDVVLGNGFKFRDWAAQSKHGGQVYSLDLRQRIKPFELIDELQKYKPFGGSKWGKNLNVINTFPHV